MSRKSKKRRPPGNNPVRRRAGWAKSVWALTSACVLLAAVYAATRNEAVRRAVGMRPLLATAVQQQGGLPLSKEYVYAGNRLVATEEPTPLPSPTPAGPPPSALVATASFPNSATTTVSLTWASPSGATPTAYIVERAAVRVSDGLKTDYAQLGQPVSQAPTPAAPYTDPAPEQGMVYAYRVRALYAGGYSDYSNQDVATTFRYSGDDPLVGAGDPLRPASRVSALQLTELRAVVEAVRKLAAKGPATWKQDPAPESGGALLAAHFAELRAQLNPALAALGISTLPDDTSIAATKPVRKEHVQDVREKVR